MPDPSPLVAISRQRGSGGAEVGRRVAAELDVRYIDRQMLRHAAEFLQRQDERGASGAAAGNWWSRMCEAMGMGATSFTHVPPSLAILSEGELLGIEERLLSREARGRIAEALAGLPESQRVVVTLRDVAGWDSEEVCAALELSEGNQRVLLHRGRAKLRAALEQYLVES